MLNNSKCCFGYQSDKYTVKMVSYMSCVQKTVQIKFYTEKFDGKLPNIINQVSIQIYWNFLGNFVKKEMRIYARFHLLQMRMSWYFAAASVQYVFYSVVTHWSSSLQLWQHWCQGEQLCLTWTAQVTNPCVKKCPFRFKQSDVWNIM